MDAKTAAAQLDTFTVVDVREQYEWDAGHIEGAVHIPLGDLPERSEELDDADKVLFVCRIGSRSANATQYFLRQGGDADNLDGGMVAWSDAGLPITTADGTEGTVALH